MTSAQKKREYRQPTLTEKGRLEKIVATSPAEIKYPA